MRLAARSCARAILGVALLACAAPARAQTTTATDPATNSRIRFGPFWINPAVQVKNVGIDTNVFNDPQDPKRDFTATISPFTDVFIRAGLFRADLRVVNDLVYYRRYTSERGSNTTYTGVFSARLVHIVPYFGLDYASTRERPGFEVDERARRSVLKARAGADYRLGSRTTIGFEFARTFLDFDENTSFRGVSLSQELDRTESVGRLTVRQALTPLTRALFMLDLQSDRFDAARTRDSDSVRAALGVEFEPIALIAGQASVGYRRLRFLGGSLEGNRGLVASVNVSYSLLAATRIGVGAVRDAQYSYDPDHPYYVLTGVNTTITQGLFSNWDVQALGGRQRLAYRDETGRRTAAAETDHATSYGFGVGYRLGRNTRLGVTVSRSRRTSPDPRRRYDGTQVGTSVTYGT